MATEVISRLNIISVTKAVAAAGDYAANDVISEHVSTGSSWVFSAIARGNNLGGYITKATILCETSSQAHRVSLYIYNALPTCELDDNVANTGVVAGDTAKFQGMIDFPAFEDIGGYSQTQVSPSTVGNLPLAFKCNTNTDDLWGVLVTRDAFTNETATDDYIIALTVEQA